MGEAGEEGHGDVVNDETGGTAFGGLAGFSGPAYSMAANSQRFLLGGDERHTAEELAECAVVMMASCDGVRVCVTCGWTGSASE